MEELLVVLLLLRLLRRRPSVEVEDEELRLFGAVPRPDGADQLGVVGADPPHHAAAAAGGQRHQVADELPCRKKCELSYASSENTMHISSCRDISYSNNWLE